MTKTAITALIDTVITRYTPSIYNTVTNAQTRDLVSLSAVSAGTVIYIDKILTEEPNVSAELEYKIGSDYFVGLAAHLNVAIVQELKQFVFTLTATPTSSYIIAAESALEAATIAANDSLVGSVTATLPNTYFGVKGVVSGAI